MAEGGLAEGGKRLSGPKDEAAATPPGHGARRGSYVTRDLTTGSIPRTLVFLAWPQMIEGVLNVVDQLADIVWAGRISVDSIAGLGVAQSYTQLAMTGRMGFDMAMRAMVSRAIGAKNVAFANHVVLQAFTLSSFFSLLMVGLGILLTEPLMRLIGVSDEVVAAGADYMRVQFIGQVTVAFRMMSGAALQASGDTFTPMKATTIVRVVHIALSPCLVFGLGPFPELGLPGAAAANALAQLIGVTMNFRALFRGTSRLHLQLSNYRLDLPLLWQFFRLGVPASVTMAERVIAQIMLLGIVAPFGDNVLAAYSLTRRTEMLTNVGSQGLGQASGIIVGQSLGAKKPERAKATVAWGIAISTGLLVIVSGLMYFLAEPFMSIFNQQPELLEIATIWLRIQVVSFVFMGASNVFAQSFNTAGDTLVPMIVTLISVWGVQQPLALVLPNLFDLGQYGVSWAVNVAIVVRCLVYSGYFLWGRWLRSGPLGGKRA